MSASAALPGLDVVAQYFGAQHPLFRAVGIRVLGTDGGAAAMAIPWSPRMGDARGALHRGAMVTMLDSACGFAIFLALGRVAPVATIDLRVDYLREIPPATGIRCRVHCLQHTPAVAWIQGEAVTDDATATLMKNENVAHVVAFSGYDFLSNSLKTSTGIMFIPLKDWEERQRPDQDARMLAGSFMGEMMGNRDAFVFVLNPPPIMGISVTGGFEMYVQQRGDADPAALAEAVNRIVAKAQERKDIFADVRSTFDANVPQYRAEVDIEKAKMLGVNLQELYGTLQATFGSLYVNDFTLGGRPFRVTLQADEHYRSKPEDLRFIYVKTDKGAFLPIESVVTVTRVSGPELIERLNLFSGARIMGSPLPGVSSGDAIRAMEQAVEQAAGEGYSYGWTGAAFHEIRAGNTAPLMYMLGLLMVFLILAAQYERWTMPLAVVTAVPFALLGAVLAVYARNYFDFGAWLFGMMVLGNPPGPPPPQLANDVYFQVGMLTLIGLAAKNAILIVEFAAMRYREGMDAAAAALEGMKLRFRPIVMTSIAFVFGCIPLAIATGAGSASRHSIGTAVIGGMLAATFIATLFVPLFYWLIERWRERSGRAPARDDGPKPHNAE